MNAPALGRGRSVHRLRSSIWVPAPPERIWPFFADAHNLPLLVPPFLDFRILTPAPIAMHKDARIDYRLSIRGLPLRWRTRIASWDPPYSFADEQERGPYKRWFHVHTFDPVDGGTALGDHVEFAVSGGAISAPAHALVRAARRSAHLPLPTQSHHRSLRRRSRQRTLSSHEGAGGWLEPIVSAMPLPLPASSTWPPQGPFPPAALFCTAFVSTACDALVGTTAPSDSRWAGIGFGTALSGSPRRDDGGADGSLAFRPRPCTRAAPRTPPTDDARSESGPSPEAFAVT